MKFTFVKNFEKWLDETTDKLWIFFISRNTVEYQRRQDWINRLKKLNPNVLLIDSIIGEGADILRTVMDAFQESENSRPKKFGYSADQKSFSPVSFDKQRQCYVEGKVQFKQCLPPTVLRWIGISRRDEFFIRALILCGGERDKPGGQLSDIINHISKIK